MFKLVGTFDLPKGMAMTKKEWKRIENGEWLWMVLTNKPDTEAHIYQVLKMGGEVNWSTVWADRPCQRRPVLKDLFLTFEGARAELFSRLAGWEIEGE